MKISIKPLVAVGLAALIAGPMVFAGGALAQPGMSMPGHGEGHGQQERAQTARGTGEVRSVDRGGKSVRLHHEAMPALNWPAMTMSFPLADTKLAKGLAPGDKVEFTLRHSGARGQYEIIEIKRVE